MKKQGKEMDIGESDLYSCMSSLFYTGLPAITLTNESTYANTRQDTQGQYSLCTIFYNFSREGLSEHLGWILLTFIEFNCSFVAGSVYPLLWNDKDFLMTDVCGD